MPTSIERLPEGAQTQKGYGRIIVGRQNSEDEGPRTPSLADDGIGIEFATGNLGQRTAFVSAALVKNRRQSCVLDARVSTAYSKRLERSTRKRRSMVAARVVLLTSGE